MIQESRVTCLPGGKDVSFFIVFFLLVSLFYLRYMHYELIYTFISFFCTNHMYILYNTRQFTYTLQIVITSLTIMFKTFFFIVKKYYI